MTIFHRIFSFIKKIVPKSVASLIRRLFTAIITPFYFSYRSGHFISSLKAASFDKDKKPLPWYTYPAIDFLSTRDFSDKRILEFGGGQSSLWWSSRAEEVFTFEGNEEWLNKVEDKSRKNIKTFLVSSSNKNEKVEEIKKILELENDDKFDLIIIDGLSRKRLVDVASNYLSKDGAIICDNSGRYGFYEEFLDRPFKRIDFFGHAPGVILPHCTSVFFKENCFLFDSKFKIPKL